MNSSTNNNGPSREWTLKMAAAEESCRSISAGGLATALGMMPPAGVKQQRIFGRFIEYARRAHGLSIEELARRADVEVAEVVGIEQHDDLSPTLRTVHQLATVLQLPAERLTEVAGLAQARPDVAEASLFFAARSEPTTELTPAERAAFEQFVKVLVDSFD